MKSDGQKKFTYRAGDSVSPPPNASGRGSLYRQEAARKEASQPPATREAPAPAPVREEAARPRALLYDQEAPAAPPAPETPRQEAGPSSAASRNLFADDTPYDGDTSYTDIGAYAEYTRDAGAREHDAAPAYSEPEYNEFGQGQPQAAGGGKEYDDYGTIINRTKPDYDLGYFDQNTAEDRGEARRARGDSPQGGAPRAGRARSAGKARGPGQKASNGGYGAAQRTVGSRVGRAVGRTFAVVGVVVAAILVLAFGAITILSKGPFPTARDKFVISVTETSAVKWLANIYFSPEEVEAILASNAVLPPEETTDTTTPFEANVTEGEEQDIEVIDIKGATYVGKLMVIKDPTRVKLATLPTFGAGIDGKKVEDFVAENNAVAGINAGGFLDLNGMGRGGEPLGVLIKDGTILSGSANAACNMIGFTAEGQLIVGVMTGQEALDKGMVEGVYFEPTLIVNGQPAAVSGNGGGLNPRTVIGQRDDGAILMLVIDGRQPHSLGASLQDCMQEMLDAGAVNASNLDGGSSSVMIYQGEMINTCASLYGSRGQPACWIVQ